MTLRSMMRSNYPTLALAYHKITKSQNHKGGGSVIGVISVISVMRTKETKGTKGMTRTFLLIATSLRSLRSLRSPYSVSLFVRSFL